MLPGRRDDGAMHYVCSLLDADELLVGLCRSAFRAVSAACLLQQKRAETVSVAIDHALNLLNIVKVY